MPRERPHRARTTPLMWSPSALHARLRAQQAADTLPRRARGFGAEARAGIRRIVTDVEQRRLSLSAATEQLRALTLRVRDYRRAIEANRGPRSWELLGGGR